MVPRDTQCTTGILLRGAPALQTLAHTGTAQSRKRWRNGPGALGYRLAVCPAGESMVDRWSQTGTHYKEYRAGVSDVLQILYIQ